AREGGSLVIAAEQEPTCADWLSYRSISMWGLSTMQVQTIPQPFISDASGFHPTPLLDGLPKVETNPERITYKINPRAVWNDGQPITAHDFKYTYNQIMTSQDVLTRYGPVGHPTVSGPLFNI